MIIRRVDQGGKLVIPSEIREAMGISSGDQVAIDFDGKKVTLNKAGGTLVNLTDAEIAWIKDTAQDLNMPGIPDDERDLLTALYAKLSEGSE